MTDRCPYVTEERGADGHHTCLASRLPDGTQRRCAYRCTVTEASLCLLYQTARAEAAERVVRLLEAVARIAESALERSVQLAAGLVGNGRWDGTEAGALSMDARNAQIVVAEALASVATLNLPEKELCQSPSDQTTSDTEPPSDAAAEGEEPQ